MPGDAAALQADYEALADTGGWIELDGRTQLELRGRDARLVLHNLCTNDIRRLADGSGCEAFITSVQGRTLGYLWVFAEGSSVFMDTAPAQAATLLPHFQKYIFREDAETADRSGEWREMLVVGAAPEELLMSVLGRPLPTERWAHCRVTWGSGQLSVRRLEAVPSALLVCGPTESLTACQHDLARAAVRRCAPALWDTLRIEWGLPEFGREVRNTNLPQEIGRDAWAISFTKGCYLGQETVARLDALGHVNWRLCRLLLTDTALPAAGAELVVAGKIVGQVTSAAWSPRDGGPLAFAYLRREQALVNAVVQCGEHPARVVAVP